MAPLSFSAAGVCVSSSPMPNINAKNITASKSLAAAAATTFFGTICTSSAMPEPELALAETISCARAEPSVSKRCASAGSTPSPGRNTFTSTRPMITAMLDTMTV